VEVDYCFATASPFCRFTTQNTGLSRNTARCTVPLLHWKLAGQRMVSQVAVEWRTPISPQALSDDTPILSHHHFNAIILMVTFSQPRFSYLHYFRVRNMSLWYVTLLIPRIISSHCFRSTRFINFWFISWTASQTHTELEYTYIISTAYRSYSYPSISVIPVNYHYTFYLTHKRLHCASQRRIFPDACT
jgi:hypothetical protein